MRKYVSAAVAMCLLFSCSTIALAAEPDRNTALDYAENVIREEVVFNKDSEFLDFSPVQSRTEKRITINLAGMSTFLNFDDMGSGFDESLVEYDSENPEVAIGCFGRILATGAGTTKVTVSYGDIRQTVIVTVLKNVSEELKAALHQKSAVTRSQERVNIVSKAREMTYVTWIPSKDLAGWENRMIFKAGTLYTGIPYSQTGNQVDDIEFKNALTSKSDFYTSITTPKVMPTYGNDCSGFVSIAWGIDRKNTSYFNDYPSLGSFSNLDMGDAVVRRINDKGHIILIYFNDTAQSSVACYEQTPCYARLSFYTYTQLTDKGYKPISKF